MAQLSRESGRTDAPISCLSSASHHPDHAAADRASSHETTTIDAAAPAHPFPHYWEQMFGSGRAVLSLRAEYRSDLRAVHQITAMQYVRFHAILDDDVGVYDEDKQGKPVYNFSYVDQIYDGLLANSVKPFIELSFMPYKLAARPDLQSFWYHPNISPPKDYTKWDDLVTQFTKHLVERYGIDEVANWYFEVWNEPNLDFWSGTPKQESYFELYDHTARDIKAVSPRLRVGGPAISAGGVDTGHDPARRRRRTCRWTSSPATFTATTRRAMFFIATKRSRVTRWSAAPPR